MLKSIKNFIARWGDLSGPVMILLTSIILMVLAAVSRDIFTDSKLGTALSVTQYFENKFYDLRVNSQIKDSREWIDPDISIVEIDDQSLSATHPPAPGLRR
jgi:CHASE2 domain-containing sensor protein